MSARRPKVAREIKAFVDHPVTNLVKGIGLMGVGLSDATHDFREGMTGGHLRVGHGLIQIGLFSILGALPHLIESLDAGARFIERREKREEADETGHA